VKIPSTIKVLGHEIKVELVEEIRDGDNVGRWEIKKNLIRIDKNMPPSQIQETLLHEIMHVINSEYDHRELEHMCQALYQVLSDNGLVFDGKADK